MLKENSPRLRLVEAVEIIICPKCNRRNRKDTDRCTECGFPLKDTSLTKVIPIELLKRR